MTALDALDTHILLVFEGFASSERCWIQRDPQRHVWRVQYGHKQKSCVELPVEENSIDEVKQYALVLLRLDVAPRKEQAA